MMLEAMNLLIHLVHCNITLYHKDDPFSTKIKTQMRNTVTSHFNDFLARTCPSSYLHRCATPMTSCIYYEVIPVHPAPLAPIVKSLVGILWSPEWAISPLSSCLESRNQTFFGSGGRNESNSHKIARISEKKIFYELDVHLV